MKPRNAAGKRPSRAADAPRRDDRRAGAVRSGPSSLLARDLMTPSPITVPEEMTVGELCDLLQEKNINGAPVVDGQGRLVGVVTQEDIIYGAMGNPGGDAMEEPSAVNPARTARRRASRSVVEVLRGRQLRVAPPPPPQAGERPFWAEHRS